MGEVGDFVSEVVKSKVTATTTAITTGGASTFHLFGYIPEDIGKLGVLMGTILSATLIGVHIRHAIIEGKKAALEIKQLRLEIERERSKTNTNDKGQQSP